MAEKNKRVRKVPTKAYIQVTIERIETVWEKSREWRKVTDESRERQYEYVDAELPKTSRVKVLEQMMPESNLDLQKVIKAINGL